MLTLHRTWNAQQQRYCLTIFDASFTNEVTLVQRPEWAFSRNWLFIGYDEKRSIRAIRAYFKFLDSLPKGETTVLAPALKYLRTHDSSD